MWVAPQLSTSFSTLWGCALSRDCAQFSVYQTWVSLQLLHACLPSQETRHKGWTALPSQPHSFRPCTVYIVLVVVLLRKTFSVFIPWLLLFITSSITDHSHATSECSLDTVSCCVLCAVVLSPLLETLTEASSSRICGVERGDWCVQTIITHFNKCQLVFCSFPFLVYYISLTWEPKAHACLKQCFQL